MKIVLLLLLVFISISGFSQKIKQKITKINGKNKIEYNGNLFDIDLNTITVKLKKGKELDSKHKFYRKNKLGYWDLKVPKGNSIENYINLLSLDESIEEIEYNSIGHYIDFIPNDDREDNQWYLSTINFYDANEITTGNTNVIVGVLDSGTDWLHSDLGIGADTYQNIYLNPGEDAWSDPNDPNTGNGIDDDGNGLIDDWKGWNYATNTNNVRTNNFHGTLVSGIIAAKTNNNHGVAGIAGGNNSEGVKIIPYCVGIEDPLGGVLDDAIIEAVDKGVKVIQLSLSVAQATSIDTAIQYAINNNVIIICASGNDYLDYLPYPASNNNVIAVGAVDENDNRAVFSNYGNSLDLVAPGVDIYGLSLNNEYTSFDGTSFAAPQVSATAALIFSLNSSFTVQEVRAIIETTTEKVGEFTYSTTSGHSNGTWNNKFGYGRLNAFNAVQMAQPVFNDVDQICYDVNTLINLNNSQNYPVTWQVSSNVNNISSNNQSITIRSKYATNPGSGWVKATVNGIEHTEAFGVNKGENEVNMSVTVSLVNNYLTITIHDGSGNTPYDLYFNDVYKLSTNSRTITFAYSQNSGRVEIRNQNSCETGLNYAFYTGYFGGSYYSSYNIFPNPTSETLSLQRKELTINEISNLNFDTNQNDEKSEFQLYDFNQNLLLKGQVEKLANIDVSNFKKGIYILLIITNGNYESHQIIIN